MDDGGVDHLPARTRLFHDLRDLALSHAGVVLEAHRYIAHQADEAGNRPDFPVPRKFPDFQAGVEVLALNRDLHPPVTGGKNATSSPALIAATGCAMSWFTATRTSFLSANTFCQAPPR